MQQLGELLDSLGVVPGLERRIGSSELGVRGLCFIGVGSSISPDGFRAAGHAVGDGCLRYLRQHGLDLFRTLRALEQRRHLARDERDHRRYCLHTERLGDAGLLVDVDAPKQEATSLCIDGVGECFGHRLAVRVARRVKLEHDGVLRGFGGHLLELGLGECHDVVPANGCAGRLRQLGEIDGARTVELLGSHASIFLARSQFFKQP